MGIIAAIYIRKSREDKTKPSHRLTVQREQLPQHAHNQGWKTEIYDDGHASAARGKTESLPERARLERDIRAGKINIILTIELSRLSRDDTLQDYVAWLTLCSDHRVRLATPSRILDPAQHSDWMLLLMEGGFSSVEMKIIQARMKEGRDAARQAGKFLGGICPPPYIYNKTTGRPEIDPEQLRELSQIWAMAETESARAISAMAGRPEIAIRRMLSDERLLFYQALRPDPQTGEPVKCDWEPVMTNEQARRIQTARGTRSNHKKGKREYCSLLSNLAIMYCGYCGHTLKTWHNSRLRTDGTRLDYYGCQKTGPDNCARARLIAQNILDDALITNLFNTLSDIAGLETIWINQTDNRGELKRIIEEETKAHQKKRRLIDAITNGIMELVDAKEAMATIKTRLENLQQQKDTILANIHEPPDWSKLDLTRDEYNSMDRDTQREIIRLAINRIDVYNMYTIITYRFPRKPNGDHTAKINLPAIQRGKRITK